MKIKAPFDIYIWQLFLYKTLIKHGGAFLTEKGTDSYVYDHRCTFA